MQLMLMEEDGDQWMFRRDNRIRGSIDLLGMLSAVGIPILRPEIQLLFKATGAIREKDSADFEVVKPSLSLAAREWLFKTLRVAAPDHRWLALHGQ